MNLLIEPLGWTLLHTLWQGTLLAVALQLAWPLLARRSAQLRYAAACLALTLFVLAPLVTFSVLRTREWLAPTPEPAAVVVPMAAATSGATVAVGETLAASTTASGAAVPVRAAALTRFGAALRPLLPWLVAAWLLGIALGGLRLALAWRRVRGLARSLFAPLPRAVEVRLSELAFRLGLRRAVCAGLSAAVDVPTVVGWARPVVLVPAAMLAGLSPAQLDALLAHELAHIRRHDFLVNLFQAVAEALFFYHPGVYAINRRIRAERENACDDIAVGVTGDAVDYARALATLEAARSTGALALAASGDGELLTRVRRLLGFTPAHGARTMPFAGAVLAASGLFVTVLLALLAAACAPAWSGKLYQAEVTLLIGRPADQPLTGASTEELATAVKVIESRAVATRVADRLRSNSGIDGRSLLAPYASGALAVEILLQNRSIIIQGQSRVIAIQYRHPDRLIAAKVANYYAQAYLEYKEITINKADVSLASELKLRVTDQERKVAAAEKAIDDFKRASGSIYLNDKSDTVRKTLYSFSTKLAEQQSELNRATNYSNQVDQYVKEGRDLTELPVISTGAISSLKGQIASANIEIKQMEGVYGQYWPALIGLKEGRKQMEQELKNAVANAVALVHANASNARDDLEATKALMQKATEDVRQLDGLAIEYDRLELTKKTAISLLQELQSKLASLTQTASLYPSGTSILDLAVPPAEGDYTAPARH